MRSNDGRTIGHDGHALHSGRRTPNTALLPSKTSVIPYLSWLQGIELKREAAMQMLPHLLSDIGKPASVDASARLQRRLVVGLGANDADGTELGGWSNGPPNVKTVGFRSRDLFPNLAVLDLRV